eukprot:4809587-Pyramimonas_sp.AAC.1
MRSTFVVLVRVSWCTAGGKGRLIVREITLNIAQTTRSSSADLLFRNGASARDSARLANTFLKWSFSLPTRAAPYLRERLERAGWVILFGRRGAAASKDDLSTRLQDAFSRYCFRACHAVKKFA